MKKAGDSMARFCQLIAIQFYKHRFISEEDVNPLRFAFELIITQFLTYASIIMSAILLGKTKETILYLILFTILRKYIQGYHADTFGMCYILTMMNYFVVLLLLEFDLPYYYINIWILYVVLFDLQKEEKRIIYLLTSLYMIALLVFYIMNDIYMLQMYSLIYGIVIIMKYVGVWKDKK